MADAATQVGLMHWKELARRPSSLDMLRMVDVEAEICICIANKSKGQGHNCQHLKLRLAYHLGNTLWGLMRRHKTRIVNTQHLRLKPCPGSARIRQQ